MCLAATELLYSNDVEEEDEMSQTSFTAQPMDWTQKYRKLIPYEHARLRAMGLGISSKEECDKLRSYHGPYLPSRPHEMYKEEWTSWEEFLGAMRSYEETRAIVRNVFKLTSMEAYHKFYLGRPETSRRPQNSRQTRRLLQECWMAEFERVLCQECLNDVG